MSPHDILLDVRDVSIRFGGLQALDKVSFDVRRGEILALIGPNGAGKSTMLNVVSGALTANTGEVRFKGERIDSLRPDEINLRGLARTFQGAEVLRGLTVRENVMAAGAARCGAGIVHGLLGIGRAPRALATLHAEAIKHLDIVGLAHLADASSALLTAGQQRLLAVARALATGAELLILDEPGAGLNAVEKNFLAEVIVRIRMAGRTVVFVEHDLAFVGKLAERMVVLDHGRLIAKGLPDEVRNDAAVIEAYLGHTDVAASVRTSSAQASAPLIEIDAAVVRYGGLIALDGVSLDIRTGEIVALVGANGAGKSTLLKAIAGAVSLTQGAMRLANVDLAGVPIETRAGMGIGLAPEGRALFPALTVRDNLLVGRYAQVRRAGLLNLLWPTGQAARELREVLDEVVRFFPRLAERLDQQAGTLSGGEGQMLAIGRALMNRPRLLMLDEPSFGLAPQVAREILEALPRLTELGVTILLVEQNARAALQVADRAYILANGRIAASGTSRELLANADIAQAYLGWEGAEQNGTPPRRLAVVR